MDDRCAAKEAQSREECESDERVASLADRAKTDAGDDLTVDRRTCSVDRAVCHPEEAADARPVAAEVHEGTLAPAREQIGAGRVVRGLGAGRCGKSCGAGLAHASQHASLEPRIDDRGGHPAPHERSTIPHETYR